MHPLFGRPPGDISRGAEKMLSQQLLVRLSTYLEAHIRNEQNEQNELAERPFFALEAPSCKEVKSSDLEDFIRTKRKPSFSQVLLDFIDSKGASDVDVYKKAGLDRRHFSKIRSDPAYRPRKTTAVALALALELDEKETDTLLSAAGYSLSESDTFDLIIQYCVINKIYAIEDVNQALDYFSLKPLGALQ
jgi:hypothetical protein